MICLKLLKNNVITISGEYRDSYIHFKYPKNENLFFMVPDKFRLNQLRTEIIYLTKYTVQLKISTTRQMKVRPIVFSQ